jgi:hypothetical protein
LCRIRPDSTQTKWVAKAEKRDGESGCEFLLKRLKIAIQDIVDTHQYPLAFDAHAIRPICAPRDFLN